MLDEAAPALDLLRLHASQRQAVKDAAAGKAALVVDSAAAQASPRCRNRRRRRRRVCLYFEGRLGLSLVHQEELEEPRVRLTYLDAGNVFIQLVEPLDDDSVAAAWLREHGDGVHHLCFAYPDAIEAAVALGEEGAGPPRWVGPGEAVGVRGGRARARRPARVHRPRAGTVLEGLAAEHHLRGQVPVGDEHARGLGTVVHRIVGCPRRDVDRVAGGELKTSCPSECRNAPSSR